MVYNEGMVNTMLRKTSTGLERQKIAVANINLLLAVSRKKKKDLAECMDKVPQALSKMLQNKQTWFFEDMCNAATVAPVMSVDAFAKRFTHWPTQINGTELNGTEDNAKAAKECLAG